VGRLEKKLFVGSFTSRYPADVACSNFAIFSVSSYTMLVNLILHFFSVEKGFPVLLFLPVFHRLHTDLAASLQKQVQIRTPTEKWKQLDELGDVKEEIRNTNARPIKVQSYP
jgi:hypothetical protein